VGGVWAQEDEGGGRKVEEEGGRKGEERSTGSGR